MAVQFTEAEMLILSSLAYTDIPKGKFDSNGYPLPNSKLSVEAILGGLDNLSKGKGYGEGMSEIDKGSYEAAIDSLKTKLIENNFVVTKSITHNSSGESGFAAFAIEPNPNPNGEVVICCRGSDKMKLNPLDSKNTLNDWLHADVALAWDEQTLQQAEMERFMKGFERYNSISLVGHSLGANLAMHGAVTFPYSNKITAVYAIDGPGYNQAYINFHRKEIERINNKIYNFQQEHDIVSSSLISIGDIIPLDSSVPYDGLDFKHHSRYAIGVEPDGRLRRESSGEKDDICKGWNTGSNNASSIFNFKDIIFSALYSVATSFCSAVGKAIKSIYDKYFNAGYQYATNNPYVELNTAKLRDYANRLWAVNRRISSLDRKMDGLYTKVGFRDLWNLLQADALTGYSWRLNRCASYLVDTASDFENLESYLSKQA